MPAYIHSLSAIFSFSTYILGILGNFDSVRPAITIGVFNDSKSEAMQSFLRVANALKGRYHFAHYIKNGYSSFFYFLKK